MTWGTAPWRSCWQPPWHEHWRRCRAAAACCPPGSRGGSRSRCCRACRRPWCPAMRTRPPRCVPSRCARPEPQEDLQEVVALLWLLRCVPTPGLACSSTAFSWTAPPKPLCQHCRRTSRRWWWRPPALCTPPSGPKRTRSWGRSGAGPPRKRVRMPCAVWLGSWAVWVQWLQGGAPTEASIRRLHARLDARSVGLPSSESFILSMHPPSSTPRLRGRAAV